MDNFTIKKLKKPKTIIKGISKGDFSLTKREFNMGRTKATIKLATDTVSKINEKVEELKGVHNRLFDKSLDE